MTMILLDNPVSQIKTDIIQEDVSIGPETIEFTEYGLILDFNSLSLLYETMSFMREKKTPNNGAK